MPLDHVFAFAFFMLMTGAAGVMLRRNLIVVLMSVELMLNSVNFAFVGVARQLGDSAGHVMVLMIFVVAAVEVAIGMAIVVNMFRQRESIAIDNFNVMRG